MLNSARLYRKMLFLPEAFILLSLGSETEKAGRRDAICVIEILI